MKRRIHSIIACILAACAFNAFASPEISRRGLPEGAKLRIGKGSLNSIAYSPDSMRFAAAGSVGVWIYDARFGKEIALFQGHTDNVHSAAYSPDGKRIVSASGDNTMRVWDAETGETLKTLIGHTGAVYSAAYSPDGRRIVSASGDNTMRVWGRGNRRDAQNARRA